MLFTCYCNSIFSLPITRCIGTFSFFSIYKSTLTIFTNWIIWTDIAIISTFETGFISYQKPSSFAVFTLSYRSFFTFFTTIWIAYSYAWNFIIVKFEATFTRTYITLWRYFCISFTFWNACIFSFVWSVTFTCLTLTFLCWSNRTRNNNHTYRACINTITCRINCWLGITHHVTVFITKSTHSSRSTYLASSFAKFALIVF